MEKIAISDIVFVVDSSMSFGGEYKIRKYRITSLKIREEPNKLISEWIQVILNLHGSIRQEAYNTKSNTFSSTLVFRNKKDAIVKARELYDNKLIALNNNIEAVLKNRMSL